ncbi:hypothetical protein [Burkholderia multivorans]|uniref:hypothetical protein n=1 Tax=Burkholderia multivorans TaxID=87883 RepID=UPI0004F76E5F|nr:hypothetical protein [Burkholderia multivorans]AIO74813.1 hypothetical protein DM80_3049 [Burkholderia multivorans]
MTDIRALKTLPEALPNVSVMTSMLCVTGGLRMLDAVEASSCHLTVALDVLSDIAANTTEGSNRLYAVLTAVGVAKGLLDSAVAAVAAIAVDGKEAHHG